ncbi:MAG TPA: hypothetical protein EYG88_00265 [Desulfocapsa sulfexigens]|nr:hypothetical protein [Desulfocapsa sulfexigens]
MTDIKNNEQCDGCGNTAKLKKNNGTEFCDDCLELADAIKKRPETIKRICKLIKSDIQQTDHSDPENTQTPKFIDLPEVLNAVRYRTRDRELNTWYVSVSELDGDPVEIFASTAFDRDDQLQSRISNLTTITRLVSLILRNVFLGEVLTLGKTIKQLKRSSRQKNDLPDMLTNVLRGYENEANS